MSSELHKQIQEVRSALNHVYNGSGLDHSQADLWLQKFQRSAEAWAVADAMLMMEELELQATFFAAVTIHHKIRYDFHELPQESVPSLRNSLLAHVTRWANVDKQRNQRTVQTRLCLALAALAVQSNWQGVVKELTSTIMTASEQEHQAGAARVVLELMKVLPVEVGDSRVIVAEAVRESQQQQLCQSAPLLLDFLAQVASGPLASDVMVQENVFKCLLNWVRYTEIRPEDLSKHPLFLATFDALRQPDLFETVVDLLVEVLRVYEDPNQSIPVVQIMVPRAMALAETYKGAVMDEDEDMARGLCRLFTEMGESYMEVIMWQHELGQLALVELLLECTSHPVHEIASIPLVFWHRFCRALDHLQPAELQANKKAAFGPCLTNLLRVLVRLMCYPEEHSQLTEDQVDDLKRHRYDVADVLSDCCKVLGGVYCLERVLGQLEMELQTLISQSVDHQVSVGWQHVEGCLFAIRSVARSIPSDEAVVMPRIMALLTQLPGDNHHIRYTANLIVGRYSEWLKLHPETLGPMFEFLLHGFSTPECAAAAATSIKNVCESCGEHMGEPVLRLHDHIQMARSGQAEALNLRDELEILEGLCHVISTLPLEAAARALRKLVVPVLEELHRHGAGTGQDDGDTKKTQQELERLMVLVRYVRPAVEDGQEHPVLGVMREAWPVLERVVARHKGNDALVEKLCRCYKHAMRTLGPRFEPLLQPLMSQLVAGFAATKQSPFLYCGSICITEFGGRGPEYARVIFRMLEDFSTVAFQALQSLDHFTQKPDMVEEYFYLVARFVDYCPEPLLLSPLLSSVVGCGVVGLALHHREAHKGVLHCFEEVVALGLDSPDRPNPKAPGYKPHVEQVLGEHGPALVRGLIGCCVGELPAYALDVAGGSVAGVMWNLFHLRPAWLQDWMVQSLKEINNNIATSFQKQELMDSLFGKVKDRDQFHEAVRHFSHVCRQNQRRWNNS